jgi:DNA-binding GntR family transcriptional regulator
MSQQLAEKLTIDIRKFIAVENLAAGVRLTERGLGTKFRVSRSPVRRALKRLATEGVVTPNPDGGYLVSSRARRLSMRDADRHVEPHVEEKVYLQIADDRLSGLLPERITENEFLRRYGMSREHLRNILRRMSQEGWIERLPGHGWMFLQTLTSSEAYNQSYRFRILVEPSAILEPSFKLNVTALERCQEQQRALVTNRNKRLSPAEIFDANSKLHETIAECSGNMFIIDTLVRINRLRRLMEYRQVVDIRAVSRRSREHLTLIDLLLEGHREAAADFMRLHLRNAAREKVSNDD